MVKPYKEKVDLVEEKINTVEKYVQEKWNLIQEYNPFKN